MQSLEIFNQHKPLLFAIAYRMLGSVADAEDMVQETFLRWQQISDVVQSPRAYLSKIMTRLCIDYMRSARARREQYIGVWLPEPIVMQPTNEPANLVELADSLSMSFLVMLESLSPIERAVFLLREVFDYEYSEIASIVGKSSANCRQILRRAKQSIQARRHYCNKISLQQREQITAKFLQAWHDGNIQDLLNLLANNVVYESDGGGKVPATFKPLYGSRKVARVLIAIRRHKLFPDLISSIALVNGEPGIVNYVNKSLHSTISLEVVESRIQSIFVVVNPEKLGVFGQY
jgi:RNA polymerase sigma-70 factor, ECF subfamily